MCTVTIIPKGDDDFVLTSNRDEAPSREPLLPIFYNINQTKMLFPKDEKAGGTWIGLSEKNRLICLLNGGGGYHKKQPKYRISRGVVVSDLLASDDVVKEIESYNLKDVEPFTIIIADWNLGLKFYELVWDAAFKHLSKLPVEPRIWSSSTLYSDIMKQERQNWFDEFASKNMLNPATALEFHKTTQVGNKSYGVIMDRGFVKTTSITQVDKKGDLVDMHFESLQKQIISTTTFKFTQAVNE